MKSANILLLRHLPTTDDVADIYTGQNDNPSIIEIAENDLQRLVDELNWFFLQNSNAELIISDNPRGQDTWAKLFNSGLTSPDPVFTSDVNNILQPEWARLHQSEVSQSSRYKEWHTNPELIRFDRGESLEDVRVRVDRVIFGSERPKVVISHTTPMQVLLLRTLSLPTRAIWSFKFDHLSFTYVIKGVLVRHNAERVSNFKVRSIRE